MAAKPQLKLTKFAGHLGEIKTDSPAADARVELKLIDRKKQVRRKLGDLTELAASIKAHGVDTPILLLALDNGRYLLIAGERRVQTSIDLDLVDIPARIFRGLTERQIRAMQVRENNDRTSLSAYDEAMGVCEDVEAYGVAGACEIWNRSDAWISKRVGVQKWSPAVVELLSDNLVGDLEILSSLNQLRVASNDEFARMENRIRHGDVPNRSELRDKVSQAKEWKRRQAEKQAAEAASAAVQAPKKGTPAPAAAPAAATRPAVAPAAPSPSPAKVVLSPEAYGAGASQVDEAANDEADAEVQVPAEDFRPLVAEFARIGTAGGTQLARVVSAVNESDGDMADADWALWSSFVLAVGPLLQPLGDRGAAFLRKLERELKTKKPEDLWREVVPVEENGAVVGQLRPDSWHF